jgi:hypothetical protein
MNKRIILQCFLLPMQKKHLEHMETIKYATVCGPYDDHYVRYKASQLVSQPEHIDGTPEYDSQEQSDGKSKSGRERGGPCLCLMRGDRVNLHATTYKLHLLLNTTSGR